MKKVDRFFVGLALAGLCSWASADALQVRSMANQHGKTCAAAVVALLTGQKPNPSPNFSNTCYSFVSSTFAVHVASVHTYDPLKKTMVTVAGSGGVSAAANEAEGEFALAWAHAIWADSLV